MNAEGFRRLALALPEAVESSHMGHPDFRVGGKIFATLDQSGARGMAKLTPDQQEVLMSAEPDVFTPCAGAWGLRGATYLILAAAEEDVARAALRLAWLNTAAPRIQARFPEVGS